MTITILQGDCRAVLATLADDSVDIIVTSPPYYGLRDYGTAQWVGGDPACDHAPRRGLQGKEGQRADRIFTGAKPQGSVCDRCGAERIDQQIGLEATLDEYLGKMVEVFNEIRRVLKPSGTCWLNIGDSYAHDGKWGGETGGKQAYLDDANRRRAGRERRHSGLKPKDLCMVPNRLALLLQAAGWLVRSEIIWHKPNPMPESVTDRPTSAHEKIFLLTKSGSPTCWRHEDGRWVWEKPAADYVWRRRISDDEIAESVHEIQGDGWRRVNRWSAYDYFFDADAVREPDSGQDHRRNVLQQPEPSGGVLTPHTGIRRSAGRNGKGRNIRNVWTIATVPFPEAHFATFPPDLAELCIKAGCPAGGTVLDPFGGAGTTALVADRLGHDATIIELNPDYVEIAERRIKGDARMFADVQVGAV